MPHVLIIRRSALGDVAMTIPVVYSVASAYPQVSFMFLTRAPFDELFLAPPSNLRVVTRLAHCERFTHVADLHNVLRSWVMDAWFRLQGCHVEMVDKRRVERRRIIHGEAVGEQFIERYRAVFQRLGFPVELTFKSIFTNRSLVEDDQSSLRPVIGVAPFARYASKTYPLDKMYRVVMQLTSKGFQVQLYGAKGNEARLLAEWADTIPQCESMAGRFTLADELRAMSRLKLMVSMDSANGHMAALVGTPVLTLWGGTTPACGFVPYGQTTNSRLSCKLSCQPCSIAGCRRCSRSDFACFDQMSPEMVVQAVCDRVK